jgi:hypothetical protein
MSRSFYGHKPLSAKQRSTLAQVAKDAYTRLAPGLSEGFDEWRKTEARNATKTLRGAPPEGWTISEAPAWAFDALMGHFQALKGATGKAYDQLTGPSAVTKNMIWIIAETERKNSIHAGYSAGICRQMWGHDAPQNENEAKGVLTALKNAIKSGLADAVQPNSENMPF